MSNVRTAEAGCPRPTRALGLLLIGGALLVGVGSSSASSVSGPKAGGTFRVALAIDQGADPDLGGSFPVLRAVCANLFNWPDRDAGRVGLPLVPEVAAPHWRITNHGKRYMFTIRRDFAFSTGKRVTASDVKFTIERALKLGAYISNFALDVVGGTKHPERGLVARGNELVVNLVRPDGALPAELAFPPFCIVPNGTPVDPNTPLNRPITAGPYRVALHNDQGLVLKPNAHYHGSRPHYPSSIVVTFVGSDLDAGIARVESGAADFSPVDVSQLAALRTRYGRRVRTHIAPITFGIQLNTTRPAFKSVAVRQAVNFATDRRALISSSIDDWGLGAGVPTGQILPPGMPGYRPIRTYPLNGPNVVKARGILRRAHKQCGSVTLYASDTSSSAAEVVKQEWARIGCVVNVKTFPGDAVYALVGRRGAPFDAFISGWRPDYIDPEDFIDLLDGSKISASNNVNYSYLDVRSVDQHIHAADRTTGEKRIPEFAQLDALIMDRYAPWVALYNPVAYGFLSKRVHGFVTAPYGDRLAVPDWSAIWLK